MAEWRDAAAPPPRRRGAALSPHSPCCCSCSSRGLGLNWRGGGDAACRSAPSALAGGRRSLFRRPLQFRAAHAREPQPRRRACSARRSGAIPIMPKPMPASPIAICCCANMRACPTRVAYPRARAPPQRALALDDRSRRRPCRARLRDLLLRSRFRRGPRRLPPRDHARSRLVGRASLVCDRALPCRAGPAALDADQRGAAARAAIPCDPRRQGADPVLGRPCGRSDRLAAPDGGGGSGLSSPHAYLAGIDLASGDYPACLAEERTPRGCWRRRPRSVVAAAERG